MSSHLSLSLKHIFFSRWIQEVIDFLLIFGGIFLLWMIILNFKELQYEWHDYTRKDQVQQEQLRLQETVDTISSEVFSLQDKRWAIQVPVIKTAQIHDYNLDEYLQNKVDNYRLPTNLLPPGNRLIIESLWVNVPIVSVKYASEKKLETADFKAELTQWVVKYPFTKEPWTKMAGSSLFFWHSTVDMRDAENNYGYVFRKLAKAWEWARVNILWKGKMYTYKVDHKEVVSPKEVGKTLSTYDDAEYITLMACYPLWTSTNRMLVRAKLIDEKENQLAMK